jgi:hypothetical protein
MGTTEPGLTASALLFGILGNVDVESLCIHPFASITDLFRKHVRPRREGEMTKTAIDHMKPLSEQKSRSYYYSRVLLIFFITSS